MNPNPLSQMPASLIVARPAETPAVPSPVAQTVWDYKHAAVTLALVLTVFGPLIVQYWPASAPAIAQVQKAAQIIADQPAAKPTATVPKESPKPPPVLPTADPYEAALREAYGIEDGPTRSIAKLRYLYKLAGIHAKTSKTPADLKTAFDADEKNLALKGELPFIRAVAAQQWQTIFPTTPATLTDADRAKAGVFFATTIGILEKLP